MTVTHGMNVAEVEALGRQLQREGDRLRAMVAEIESVLHGVSWEGPDARRFRDEWWPNHRGRLAAIGEQIGGFGQSALNNASEQRSASGEGGVSASSGTGRAATTPTPAAAPSVAPVEPRPGSHSGEIGASSGMLEGSQRAWQQVQADYESNSSRFGLGSWGPNGESRYQCTAWANYRWRELGYVDGPMISGDGWEMASNAPGEVSSTPTLGAMASYGAGTGGNYGHVMIVEEIQGDRMRVSEMNTESDYEFGRPEEFKADRWWVRTADGWKPEKGGASQSIRFAALPK